MNQSGVMRNVKLTKVDVKLVAYDRTTFLFTSKQPNQMQVDSRNLNVHF